MIAKNSFWNKKILALLHSVFMISFISILLVIDYSYAQAVPVPKGIDGRIFYLDGVTELFKGVPVEITNIETGQVIKANTGRGSDGRYSVSINWLGNPKINVKACNPINCVESNVTLTGVIHNLDLRLNMSIPNLAPNITSVPILNGEMGKLYEYNLEAFDWNGDEIVYWLEVMPEGMVVEKVGKESGDTDNTDAGNTDADNIDTDNADTANTNTANTDTDNTDTDNTDTGDTDTDNTNYKLEKEYFKVLWTPKRDQGGINKVVLKAYDGEFYATQEFEIDVLYENSAPMITSSPWTVVEAKELYKYQIDAFDNEADEIRFEIVSAPQGAFLENNTLFWQTKNKDTGVYLMELKAVDSYNESSVQSYNLTVLSYSPKQNQNGNAVSSGNSGLSAVDLDRDSNLSNSEDLGKSNKSGNSINGNSNHSNVSSEGIFGGLSNGISYYDETAPYEVLMEKLVYQYLPLALILKENDNGFFRVSNEWMKEWGVDLDNIALYGYCGFIDSTFTSIDSDNLKEGGGWKAFDTTFLNLSEPKTLSGLSEFLATTQNENMNGANVNYDDYELRDFDSSLISILSSKSKNKDEVKSSDDIKKALYAQATQDWLFFEAQIPKGINCSRFAISVLDDVLEMARGTRTLEIRSPLTLLGKVTLEGSDKYLPKSSRILVVERPSEDLNLKNLINQNKQLYEGELLRFPDGTYRYQVTLDSSLQSGYDVYFKEGLNDETPILLESVEPKEFLEESIVTLDLNLNKASFDNPAFKITGFFGGTVDGLSQEVENRGFLWLYIPLLVIFINVGFHIFLIPRLRAKNKR